MAIMDRFQHAWNALRNKDPIVQQGLYSTPVSYGSSRPGKYIPNYTTERTMLGSILTRIATDCISAKIEHVKLDENGIRVSTMNSGINRIFNVEANMDQSNKSFMLDMVYSILDEGCVAVVPIDTDLDPTMSNSYDIQTMRVCKILAWHPYSVEVNVYNEETAQYERLTVPKSMTAIIENPFYSVMNEENSTMKRLARKLSLLDAVDADAHSGKLDVIVQVPYSVKSQTQKKLAEAKVQNIRDQLTSSDYGVAYVDSTERVIQLNRSVENKLLAEIEYLTNLLYTQLFITPEIMNGTSDEKTTLNYYKRTIDTILDAIVSEFIRKYLTRTAMAQGQSFIYSRNPFTLTPISALPDIVDKFTRNEVLSSNEVRGIIGFKPSPDPKADMLKNKNIRDDQSSDYGIPTDSTGPTDSSTIPTIPTI